MQDCVVSSKQKVVTCCVLIYEHASTKQTKNRQYPEWTAGCHITLLHGVVYHANRRRISTAHWTGNNKLNFEYLTQEKGFSDAQHCTSMYTCDVKLSLVERWEGNVPIQGRPSVHSRICNPVQRRRCRHPQMLRCTKGRGTARAQTPCLKIFCSAKQ